MTFMVSKSAVIRYLGEYPATETICDIHCKNGTILTTTYRFLVSVLFTILCIYSSSVGMQPQRAHMKSN